MATTIVNPSGMGQSGMGAIDSAFNSIYSMFGNAGQANTSSGGSGPMGITPQPVSGSDNSLTAFWRGLSNLAGSTAPALLQAGAGTLGAGLGVTGQGLNTLAAPTQFYQQLLSGDPNTTTAALAPTAANIAQIYGNVTDQASRGLPVGGNRMQTGQDTLFAQKAAVGNAALGQESNAAGALAGISGQLLGAGQGLGQLGAGLTGQAESALQNTITDVLAKMGINITGGTTSQISSLIGALV